MKQYTTTDQTAKLIELGFEKPPKKGLLFQSNIGDCHTDLMVAEENYSLGELIEMLPEAITFDDIKYSRVISKNEVYYYSWIFEVYHHIFDLRDELIDNLFDMCVKLKEEGVI